MWHFSIQEKFVYSVEISASRLAFRFPSCSSPQILSNPIQKLASHLIHKLASSPLPYQCQSPTSHQLYHPSANPTKRRFFSHQLPLRRSEDSNPQHPPEHWNCWNYRQIQQGIWHWVWQPIYTYTMPQRGLPTLSKISKNLRGNECHEPGAYDPDRNQNGEPWNITR